jgi:hypothetical protein
VNGWLSFRDIPYKFPKTCVFFRRVPAKGVDFRIRVTDPNSEAIVDISAIIGEVILEGRKEGEVFMDSVVEHGERGSGRSAHSCSVFLVKKRITEAEVAAAHDNLKGV